MFIFYTLAIKGLVMLNIHHNIHGNIEEMLNKMARFSRIYIILWYNKFSNKEFDNKK